jgi:diguanylate cyclase (GGDEF)-like protein
VDPVLHTILTLLLAVLVIILTALLFIRRRAEKKQAAAIARMSAVEFAELLRSNSLEGTIQVVASKVSDLLKSAFGCEGIVFLRKQRGFLELNYYHGIRRFSRGEFRTRFTRELAEELRKDFRPRPLDTLDSVLPQNIMAHLRRHNLDLVFPIYWRDNLYGIYFIHSSLTTDSETFHVLIAALAQSLSAAYHIKWHENKLERERRKNHQEPSPVPNNAAPRNVLRLVRNRNADSVVREIFRDLQKDLRLRDAVLMYEPREKDGPLRVLQTSSGRELRAIDRQQLRRLAEVLTEHSQIDLERAAQQDPACRSAADSLNGMGLRSAVVFPLSRERAGLFLWGDSRSPAHVSTHLRDMAMAAQELVYNAESFEQAEEMSYTDGLTGLANRRYFLRRLHEEIDRAKRYSRSLALIIFDMDELKVINDTHGHLAGDAVIRRLGQILRRSIRAIDIIARYGGDEFCVIMPEADGEQCRRFMERLQHKIGNTRFAVKAGGPELVCTISLGGSVYPSDAAVAEDLIHNADMALLAAKEAGRNSYRQFSPDLKVGSASN